MSKLEALFRGLVGFSDIDLILYVETKINIIKHTRVNYANVCIIGKNYKRQRKRIT